MKHIPSTVSAFFLRLIIAALLLAAGGTGRAADEGFALVLGPSADLAVWKFSRTPPLPGPHRAARAAASVGAPSFGADSATLTNAYLPLRAGDEYVYQSYGIDPTFTITWTAVGVENVGGVSCLKVVVAHPGGEEEWWLAQAEEGVYLLRQNDVLLSPDEAILLMTDTPTTGEVFWPGTDGEEVVVATGVPVPRLSTGLGPYSGAVKTRRDYGAGDFDYTYYVAGIGVVWNEWNDEGASNGLELASVTHAVPMGGNLTGRVTDTRTGAALPGATVTLQPSGASATTDFTGKYAFDSLAPGTYQVTASKAGYETGSGSGSVAAATMTTVNLALTPVETPTTGTVGGRVTDEDSGRGVRGVTITLMPGNYRTKTDSNGDYLLTSIPPGTYQIKAESEGTSRAVGEVTVAAGETATVNFTRKVVGGSGGGGCFIGQTGASETGGGPWLWLAVLLATAAAMRSTWRLWTGAERA